MSKDPTPAEMWTALAVLAAAEAAREAAAAVVPVAATAEPVAVDPIIATAIKAANEQYQAEVTGVHSKDYNAAEYEVRARLKRDHDIALANGHA